MKRTFTIFSFINGGLLYLGTVMSLTEKLWVVAGVQALLATWIVVFTSRMSKRASRSVWLAYCATYPNKTHIVLGVLRYCWGVFFMVGAIGCVLTPEDLDAGLFFLLFSLFITSPLAITIFEQDPRDNSSNYPVPPATPWNAGARNVGIILLYGATAAVINHKYMTLGWIALGVGCILLLSRPLAVWRYYRQHEPWQPAGAATNIAGQDLPEDTTSRVVNMYKASDWQQPLAEAAMPEVIPEKPLPAATGQTPVTETPLTAEKPTVEIDQMAPLKEAFDALQYLPAQRRGYAFQDFLNQLFAHYQLSPKTAFRLVGEEIDGSFELESHFYLVEAKWQAKPCPQSDLLVFNSKVEGKSAWARGILISYNGFTAEGLDAFARGKRTSIIGLDGKDLEYVLEGQLSLPDLIKRKIRKAVETNRFFVPVSELEY